MGRDIESPEERAQGEGGTHLTILNLWSIGPFHLVEFLFGLRAPGPLDLFGR